MKALGLIKIFYCMYVCMYVCMYKLISNEDEYSNNSGIRLVKLVLSAKTVLAFRY